MAKAIDVRVTGTVQGVSFRAYAREEARSLGVTGWLRNERDGSVAGHFEGSEDAVDALVAWCGRGPSYAEVDEVVTRETEPTGATSFVIG